MFYQTLISFLGPFTGGLSKVRVEHMENGAVVDGQESTLDQVIGDLIERAMTDEPFEDVRQKYAFNVTVRVKKADGTVMANGTITEAYQYGSDIFLALYDADEPLAWTLMYKGRGKVRHYDEIYDLEVVES